MIVLVATLELKGGFSFFYRPTITTTTTTTIEEGTGRDDRGERRDESKGIDPQADDPGGGIFNHFGTLTLTNSTVSGNTASVEGGGIYNYSGVATLTHATLNSNSAPTGANRFALPDSVSNMRVTILANPLGGGTNCGGGTITSQGFNLEFPGTSCGSEVQSDPLLTTSANNGGLTPTHVSQPGSAAIDAVGTGCPPPATDQRGVGRPLDGDGNGTAFCDIGAFEKTPPPPPPKKHKKHKKKHRRH